MTQESLIELISSGVKHVSAIGCGRVGVSLSTLRRMSEAISISTDVLGFGPLDKSAQQDRISELQGLCSRLSHLPPSKFRVAKDIIEKLLEALAIE